MFAGQQNLKSHLSMQKALLSSARLPDVLQAVCSELSKLLQGAKVAIFLADNESITMRLMSSQGYSQQSVEQLKAVAFNSDSLLSYVVEKRLPVSGLSGQVPTLSASIMTGEESRLQLALPLIASNLLVGAIQVDTSDTQLAQQLDWLKELSEMIAMILATSIRFGRLEYERDRLDTLYKSSCALSSNALKLQAVLQIALDTALVVTNTPNGVFLLIDPESNNCQISAFKGLQGNSFKTFDLNLKDSMQSACLASGKVEYFHNEDKNLAGLPKDSDGGTFASVLAVPIIHLEQPLGVIMVFSSDKHAFKREQVELLSSLMPQVATALYIALSMESTSAQTVRDPHTDLYNRWHFTDSLNKEIERSQRHRRQLALLLIDVDHLATINEHLGSQRGDEALTYVAAVVQDTVRDIDIPCRWGGDELAVILPETASNHAREVAERLRLNVRSGSASGIGMITVSIGIATFPGNAVNALGLITVAQQALDIAKFEGRDRIRLAVANDAGRAKAAWDELALKARLALCTERQSHLQSHLTVAPEYANWIQARPARLKGKKSSRLPG